MYRFILSILLLLLIPANEVFASTSTNPETAEGPSSIQLFSLIFYLGVIILLIYLFFWFIVKRNRGIKSNIFNHLGGIPLGQNKTVQVVEIGNKIYILGVGEDVQAIQVIENEEDIEAIKETIKPFDVQNTRLAGWLKSKLNFKNKGKFENQFEYELAEKIEQLKGKRIQSVNQLFDEERDNHE